MATVPSEVSEQTFAGTGGWSVADCSFPIQRTSDLVVYLTLSGGEPVLQVEGVDYEVTEAPAAAAQLTMTTPPPADSVLKVSRTVPIRQTTNLVTSGPFSPAVLTELLDYRTYVEQQLARRIAALEALGSLVTITPFEAQTVTITVLTDAADVETTFAGGAVNTVLAGDGDVTGVVVTKVTLVIGSNESLEAVTCTDWTWAAPTLTLNYITGLAPDCQYDISLLVLRV